MLGRTLRLIIGAIIILCSTPSGMAKGSIPREARAYFFAQAEQSWTDVEAATAEVISQGSDEGPASVGCFFSPIEEAAIAGAETSIEPTASNSAKQTQRYQKRLQKQSGKCSAKRIVSTSLSVSSGSEGTPGGPLAGDALKQRTSMIRFLHLAAVID